MVTVIWLWALVSILIIGAIAVVATGRWGSMSDVYEDRPDVTIPAATLSGQRVKDVRFSHSIRGYRQDEVDTLLDLVAAELDRREEMLRRADIPLEPSAAGTPGGRRRRADPSTRAPDGPRSSSGSGGVGHVDGDGPSPDLAPGEDRIGYPWDGPAR
jgi:DivIVA domain-containing protein